MIIVSQDKRSIVNFEKVKIININRSDLREIAAYFNCDEVKSNDNILLGTYETEERAREVLGEIIKIYECCRTKDLKIYGYNTGNTYYMPQE